jgi:citrate synthase
MFEPSTVTNIVISFFGAVIAILVAAVGVFARSWQKELLNKSAADSAANGAKIVSLNEKLDRVLDINERQSVEIAKLGVGMNGLSQRVTDIDRNLGQRITEVESRQHRLANQLNTVVLAIGIKLRRNDLADPDLSGGGGGEGGQTG